jgi:hypothetical protein
MKTYEVTLPITGYINVQIEAEGEEDAIDRALLWVETSASGIYGRVWSAVRHIMKGGHCFAMEPWDAQATVISDEDES